MRYGLTHPTREFAPWFKEFDTAVGSLLNNTKEFNPACDVDETDSHYLMTFDLPGVSKDEVKIEVVDKQLTVSGERRNEKTDDKNNRHLTERYYGQFQRVFSLPSTIDAAHVEATYKDGVLRIALPKSENTKPRQIKISEGKEGFFSKLTGHDVNKVS